MKYRTILSLNKSEKKLLISGFMGFSYYWDVIHILGISETTYFRHKKKFKEKIQYANERQN